MVEARRRQRRVLDSRASLDEDGERRRKKTKGRSREEDEGKEQRFGVFMLGFLGLLIVSSFVEMGLAVRARHAFGGTSGLIGVVVGMALLAFGFLVSKTAREKSWMFATLRRFGLCWLVWLFLLISIRIATFRPDNRYTMFPKRCLVSPEGCTRVSRLRPFRNEGLDVFEAPVQVDDLIRLVVQWVDASSNRNVLSIQQSEPFVHIHVEEMTKTFGFPDSLSLLTYCNETSGLSELWAHSEVRLGKGDSEANYRRIRNLWSFLRNATLKEVKHSACHPIAKNPPKYNRIKRNN